MQVLSILVVLLVALVQFARSLTSILSVGKDVNECARVTLYLSFKL